jgi:hypothetical protein
MGIGWNQKISALDFSETYGQTGHRTEPDTNSALLPRLTTKEKNFSHFSQCLSLRRASEIFPNCYQPSEIKEEFVAISLSRAREPSGKELSFLSLRDITTSLSQRFGIAASSSFMKHTAAATSGGL